MKQTSFIGAVTKRKSETQVGGTAKKKFPPHQVREFIIAGVTKKLFIDSGNTAGGTLMTLEDFDDIAKLASPDSVKQLATSTAPRMLAFASGNPLQVVSAMKASISPVENTEISVMANIYAIAGATTNLLQHSTAVELQVLKVGYDECHEVSRVNCVGEAIEELSIDETFKPFPVYPDYKVRLKVKENSSPKCFWYDIVKKNQEPLYKNELDRYVSLRIVERVDPNKFYERVSQAMAVPKNHGKDVRIVVNFINLNKDLENTNEIKMPTCSEMTRFTAGKQWLGKIDLTIAFLHIEIHPDDRELTVFYTRHGLFQCCRMMFGLKISPQEFQFIMVQVLKAFVMRRVAIITSTIYSLWPTLADSREELQKIYEEIIATLKEKNFVVNEEKSIVGVQEVEIVVFLASTTGVKITPKRIEAAQKLKVPTSKAELKSLLGFFTFFGHHIPSFASISSPLWKLLRMSDKQNFNWNVAHDRALEKLKENTLADNVLSHFNPKRRRFLLTDASPTAVGAVLFQIDDEEENVMEKVKIILFASKVLPSRYENLHQFEREIFGVTWSLMHCKTELAMLQNDNQVVVLTDLRTAKVIMEKAIRHGGRATQKRFDTWIHATNDIDYTIRWIAGKINVADCLSRLSQVVSSSKNSDEFEQDFVVNYDDQPDLSEKELEELYKVCLICILADEHQYYTWSDCNRECQRQRYCKSVR